MNIILGILYLRGLQASTSVPYSAPPNPLIKGEHFGVVVRAPGSVRYSPDYPEGGLPDQRKGIRDPVIGEGGSLNWWGGGKSTGA